MKIDTIEKENSLETQYYAQLEIQASTLDEKDRQIAQITLVADDGKLARYFVGVAIKNGKPVLSVNYAPGPSQYNSPKDKKITARWFTLRK